MVIWLPVLLLVGLIWHALAAPPPARLGANTAAATPTPGIQVMDTTVIGWGRGAERGKKLWRVTARRIGISSDQHLTSFSEITDGTLFRDGRPQASLKAGAAVYDRYAESLLVQGGVELRLADQDARLSTDRLTWQEKSRRVEIPGAVMLQTPDYRLQAARAHVDVRRDAVHVVSVTGDWRGVRLTAATCDYRAQSQSLKLTPVRLAAPDWTLDAASARLDPRTGNLRAEHVHMSSTTPFLTLAQRGRAAGTRLAAVGLAAGLLTSMAAAAPAESPKKPEPPQAKTVLWEADYTETHNHPDGTQVILLRDNVRFTHIDAKDPNHKMILTADNVVATEHKDGTWVAVATGSPKAADERSTVTGEKITIYLKERRAVTEGKVKIVTRPKEATTTPPPAAPVASASGEGSQPGATPASLRERIKGDVIITGDRAEYNYRQKTAVIEGKVVVTNKGDKLTTPKAVYSDKTETVLLSGPIDYVDAKSQTSHFEGDVQVSLKEGEESLQSLGPKNHVRGQIFIKEDDDEETPGTKPSQSSTPAPAEPKPAAPKSSGGG